MVAEGLPFTLYGLIGTAWLNGLDPEAYLRCAFGVRPTNTINAD